MSFHAMRAAYRWWHSDERAGVDRAVAVLGGEDDHGLLVNVLLLQCVDLRNMATCAQAPFSRTAKTKVSSHSNILTCRK